MDATGADIVSTEPMVPAGEMPTCPLCGRNDAVVRVTHPDGGFFCSCGTLFTGTDAEWRRWAAQRRERLERAIGTHKPVPVQTSHHTPVRRSEDDST